MIRVRVRPFQLFLVLMATYCLVQAACDNQLEGFRLGISRQMAVDEMKALGLTFTSSTRSKDGLEVLQASNGALRFWVKAGRIIAMRGEKAQFCDNLLKTGISETEVRNLLGAPSEEKFIEGGEDVVDIRHLYYKDDTSTLLVALGDGSLRGKSGWVVTSLYLYEGDWI